MAFNNETVYRQMPWAGNIAKTMTSNGEQFTACWPLLHVIRACSWRWPDVVAGIFPLLSKCLTHLFPYITNHLMTGPSGNSSFCFPRISMFSSAAPRGNIEILGKQNELFPSGPVIKCLMFTDYNCPSEHPTSKGIKCFMTRTSQDDWSPLWPRVIRELEFLLLSQHYS